MENKITIEEGKNYILDATFRNGGEVKVVKVYGKLFCRVRDLESEREWDTMLNRLSEKDIGDIVKP